MVSSSSPFHCPPGLQGSVRHNEVRRGFGYNIVSEQRRRCRWAYGREEHASLFLVLRPHQCRVVKVLRARDLLMTEKIFYNVSFKTCLRPFIQRYRSLCSKSAEKTNLASSEHKNSWFLKQRQRWMGFLLLLVIPTFQPSSLNLSVVC